MAYFCQSRHRHRSRKEWDAVLKRPIKKRKPAQREPLAVLLLAGGTGLLCGMAVMVVIALLGAYLSLQTGTPQAMVLPSALAAVFAGGYLCAFWGAKKSKQGEWNPYAGGFTAGGMFLAVMVLVSLFVPAGENQTALTRFAPLLTLLAATLLGSLTAAVHRPSGKRKMKKLMAGRR